MEIQQLWRCRNLGRFDRKGLFFVQNKDLLEYEKDMEYLDDVKAPSLMT